MHTAGRLRNYLLNWESITDDPFILQCVTGYKIPFLHTPNQSALRHKIKNSQSDKDLCKAIADLFDKGAIENCNPIAGQFLSPYFLVPKPDGTNRFILNLKQLNEYVKTEHFKLEDMKTATKLVSPESYMITIDLQDAYFLVPVDKHYRKFLRFRFQNKTYQFTCLPFGLSSSPFVFTKILKPVISNLRQKGFISVIFLDDILCIGDTYDECLKNALETIKLLQKLGFIINFKKSKLEPSKICKFLGFLINAYRGTLSLPEEKKKKLIELLNKFIECNSCKIVDFARILGKLVATCPAIQYGWLYTKAMETEKLKALEKVNGDYNSTMNISDAIKADVKWWITNIPIGEKFFRPTNFEKVIFTDASDKGWGATDGVNSFHGVWLVHQLCWSINYKELYTVWLALERLAKGCFNCTLLLRIDNTTAISYINRMGGVRYDKYNILTRKIWQWAERRKVILKASYIPSKENREADTLSRLTTLDTEWELSEQAFDIIIQNFGQPKVDLFAENKKCEIYYSWLPDPHAQQIDAFTVSWTEMFFYAFPPFILILKTLQKIIKDKATGIIVIPSWSNQPWFPLFKRLIISDEIIFQPNENLLLSVCRTKNHPRAANLHLIAAIISAKHIRENKFPKNQ